MKPLFLALTVLTFLLTPRPSLGRWAKPEEAEAILEKSISNIEVEPDGRFRENSEIAIKILSEAKRQEYATYRLDYSRRSSTYKVTLAETIVDGKAIPVSSEMIEDRLVSESSVGELQDDATLSVAFPAVVVGSTIHLKLETEGQKPLVPGFFFSLFQADPQLLVQSSQATIRSKTPLSVHTVDPDQWFDVKQTHDDDHHVLHIELKRPTYHWAVEEDQIFFYAKDVPRVEFSTLSEPFHQVARFVAPQFEAELQKPLPETYAAIRTSAANLPSGIPVLNHVMAEIGKRIRYHRERLDLAYDLRPRTLERITKTGFGDCKDFSISLTAILRSLGWEARPALVTWGPTAAQLLTSANHAIVWAKFKGKEYWVDPTTGMGAAEDLAEELADRPAFVLFGDHAELRQTPKIDPRRNVWILDREYQMERSKKNFQFAFSTELKGLFALSYLGRTIWDSEVFDLIPDSKQFLSHQVEPYDYTSKEYEPIVFKGTGVVKDPSIKTSLGKGYYWGPGRIEELLLHDFATRVSDLDVDVPGKRAYKVLLKGAKLVGNPLSCKFQSPWLDGSRSVQKRKNEIAISDEFFLKMRIISNATLRSAPFKEFQDQLESCFGPSAVLYKFGK